MRIAMIRLPGKKAFAQIPEPDGRGCEFVGVFVKKLSIPSDFCMFLLSILSQN